VEIFPNYKTNFRVPHPCLPLARVGILTFLGGAIHPATTRGRTNVKNPTLTSNRTTLGWVTLEILAGNQRSCSLDMLGGPPRRCTIGGVYSSSMKLLDLVGRKIVLFSKSPFTLGKAQAVTLHGVESGGIWIETEILNDATLQMLETTMLAGTPVIFLPYNTIDAILAGIPKTLISEGLTE
jgi:hypothetical protein